MVVAGEHRDVVALAAQAGDDLRGFRAKFVAHGDRAQHLAVAFDEDRGSALLLHALHLAGQ